MDEISIVVPPPEEIVVTVPSPSSSTNVTLGPGQGGAQGPQGVKGDTGATGPAGANGQGVPTGGATGKLLAKKSGTDYDTEWITPPVTGVTSVSGTPPIAVATGTTTPVVSIDDTNFVKTNRANAIVSPSDTSVPVSIQGAVGANVTKTIVTISATSGGGFRKVTVNSAGTFYVGQTLTFSGFTGADAGNNGTWTISGFNSPTSTTFWIAGLATGGLTGSPVAIYAGEQSANLQEWKTSGGSVVASVDAGGQISGNGANLRGINPANSIAWVDGAVYSRYVASPNPISAWNSSTDYIPGELVYYNNTIYRAYTYTPNVNQAPGSTFYWTAISPKLVLDADKGSAGGVASLDGSGLVPTTQLPSYTETSTLQNVTSRGATTPSAISLTNTTNATSYQTGSLIISGGVGIAKDLYVQGNMDLTGNININGTITGNLTEVNVTNLNVSDSLIYLADNNLTSDSVDIGIYGAYRPLGDTSGHKHTGLIRDHNDSGIWKLVSGAPEVVSNDVDFGVSDANVNFDQLKIKSLIVTDASTTRTNLGLGTMSTQNTSSYYTKTDSDSRFDAIGAAATAQASAVLTASADATTKANAVQTNLDTHTVATTAHGSTSSNTPGAIVQRDGSGNFSAGTITANTSTAAVDTNTTQIASTAFVLGQANTATTPIADGTATIGTSTRYARADHIHPTDTTRAATGANSDITSLSGLTTALSVGQGGTGQATLTSGNVLIGNGTSGVTTTAVATDGSPNTIVKTNPVGGITASNQINVNAGASSGAIRLLGSTSGASLIQAPTVASGTQTLPTQTGTLVSNGMTGVNAQVSDTMLISGVTSSGGGSAIVKTGSTGGITAGSGGVTSTGAITSGNSSGSNAGSVKIFSSSSGNLGTILQAVGTSSGVSNTLSLPTTDGTLVLTSGNTATATALQTARNINGVPFNGTANITVADATKLPTAGGTMTGAITTATPSATQESIILPYGAAPPSSPTVGSLFSTGGGGFSNLNYYNGAGISTVLTSNSTIGVAYGGTGATATTGSGNNVLDTSPTITSPIITTSIQTNSAVFNAFTTTTTNLSIGSAATTLSIGGAASSTAHTYSSGTIGTTIQKAVRFADGAVSGSNATQTISIGTGAISTTTTGSNIINIGTGALSNNGSTVITLGGVLNTGTGTSRVVINNPTNAPNVQAGTPYTIPDTAPTPNVVLTSTALVTITLPTAVAGKEVRILCQGAGGVNSASSNVYPKTSRSLGATILGGAGSAILVCDGTNWQIMA